MYAWTLYSILYLVFLKEITSRTLSDDNKTYHRERDHLITAEKSHRLGGRLQLSEDEEKLNSMLKTFKEKEINESFVDADTFKLSQHYFKYQPQIGSSKIYQIIRRMPKGALLHLHGSLAMDADYLLSLTYEDHLYACYTDDHFQLQFSDTVPSRPCPSGTWTLLSDMRSASRDVAGFDDQIKQHFTLNSQENMHDDINTIWEKFNKVYYAIKSLIMYRPVREKYIYDLLKRHYDDNILYVEMRGGLQTLYELDGRTHGSSYMAKMYQRVAEKFKERHPDFIGIKLIITRNRATSLQKVYEALSFAKKLKKEVPDLIAGFDLVGQEDLGKPLKDFLPALLEYKRELNYYFHGGETNWYGTTSDENLYDAILLGTKRIGHAYSLLKHPILMSLVKERDIALEVNVISNSILSLVRDVRNHPLSTYMALDLPVVLASDDPGAWGATPLSHDFYVAFVGVANVNSDLRMLKQLAINSIKYSALDDKDKNRFFAVFYKRWDEFVTETIHKYSI